MPFQTRVCVFFFSTVEHLIEEQVVFLSGLHFFEPCSQTKDIRWVEIDSI